MYIGLIDQDALFYPKKFFPNLEIMKLASYHKKQRNIVEFILDVDIVDKYSKFYLRKDLQDGVFYDTELILKKGCEYGGLAFTQGLYSPLPDEIEQCIPDFTIYRNFFKRYNPKIKCGISKNILDNATYLRAIYNDKIQESIVENTIYNNTYGRANIYIYDQHFLTWENLEYLSELMQNSSQKVKFLYPQRITDFNLAKNICKEKYILPFSSKSPSFIFEKTLYNADFLEIFKESKSFKNTLCLEMGLDKYKTYTSKFFEQEIAKNLNWMIYCIVNKNRKIKFVVSPTVPEGEYRTILFRMQYWYNNNFYSVPFKDFVSERGSVMLEKITELSKKNNYLNRLLNVSPKKIVDSGGKWYL